MHGKYVEFELGDGVVRVYDSGVAVGVLRRDDGVVSIGVYVKPSVARGFVEDVRLCLNGGDCGAVVSADLVSYSPLSNTLRIEHAGVVLEFVVVGVRVGDLIGDIMLARQQEALS